MFSSVLIANRGEIACRIIRTARQMGLRTIAVHSEADARSMHVAFADVAVEIGPPPAALSYLDSRRIIEAAIDTGAEAIHPGYGFLAEDPEFARAVLEAGLIFVGPPVDAIRIMGRKDVARDRMQTSGVPVVPGCPDPRTGGAALADMAESIGFPVLVKPVAGGGGIGMKRADSAAELDAAVAAARREAVAAFGEDAVLVEKLVAEPRHVEVQIFADRHGQVVHLFERDCSLQRRHQKLIEEAPAPGMTPGMREAMTEAAVTASRAVGYVGAGTVEFIVDASDGMRSDRFWFLEMNTRLQVEHPVTEAVTGIDLVEWQFRIAAGERLPRDQHGVRLQGHAIEARLYAEDPDAGFLPSPGPISEAEFPCERGIRVDAGIRAGGTVPAQYDPLLAKLVSHGRTREEARNRLISALDQTYIDGVRTNRTFLRELARSEPFVAGRMTTGTVEQLGAKLFRPPPDDDTVDLAAVAAAGLPVGKEWFRGFSLWRPLERSTVVVCDGESREAKVAAVSATKFIVNRAGNRIQIEARSGDLWVIEGRQILAKVRQGGGQLRICATFDWRFQLPERGAGVADGTSGEREIRAPMSGQVVSVLATPGARVYAGAVLVTVEAMKMEHRLASPADAVVAEVFSATGSQVREGDLLVTLEPDS